MRLHISLFISIFIFTISVKGQVYYYNEYAPFESAITSPEQFLGYKIGEQHTRHDQVVSYFELLARQSKRVIVTEYGHTHENRKLLILTISTKENIENINAIKNEHLALVNPNIPNRDHFNLPLFIHLGYNVHGNEPSGTEAALLTAYTLVASLHPKIKTYLNKAVFFIDPALNPDGRDRHTQWVNSKKSKNLVADPLDFEHTEAWPTGRTNHYWFDLNRDWLLAVHPESKAKLKWFHEWYPNIITDFHEMRTSTNTFFFEPEKVSGSLIPMATKENAQLNAIFAKEFATNMEGLSTFYFTGELYDATYPGYGSTYGDLQGSLALLFEQTSTRGHLKMMDIGTLSFEKTILNQYVAGMTTIKTAVTNKDRIYDYQQNYFRKVKKEAAKSTTKAYVFSSNGDRNTTQEFIKLLKRHQIKVYQSEQDLKANNKVYFKDKTYIVPCVQDQYKMVQSMFETYNTYRDSVFYDASAWSVVNFFNLPYYASKKKLNVKKELSLADFSKINRIEEADYAYLIPWTDYYAPAFLYGLQKAGIQVKALTKKLTITLKNKQKKEFSYGSIMLPIGLQNISKDSIYSVVNKYAKRYTIPVTSINKGNNGTGITLGSRSLIPLKQPKVIMWVGDGVSPYEAGEVWHLMDTRIEMPISKIALNNFNKVNLSDFNTMVLVSGSYNQLDERKREKIKNWVAQGNTLITSRRATSWVIRKGLVQEQLLKTPTEEKDSTKRVNYVDADENYGKHKIGGAIFKVDLDITHPIGYGYQNRELPIYKNNEVWMLPSKTPYSTVARYTNNAHIDGYISKENYKKLSKTASIVVSPIGKGRVVLFADNPNFRGSWYGTNKLFLNAVFFGNHIHIPK